MASIEFQVSRVEITSTYGSSVNVELDDVDITDAVEQFGKGDLLDEIGEDEAIAHFGLTLKEDEE